MSRLAVLPVVLLATACAPSFTQVSSLANVPSGQKVVIGDMELADGGSGEWSAGLHERPSLLVGYELRVRDGQVVVSSGEPLLGEDGQSAIDPRGGVFHLAVDNREVFLVSLNASFFLVLANKTVFVPLLFKIAPSPNRCEYIGRIVVRKTPDDHVQAHLVDDFDRFKDDYAKRVTGCDLKKAIAIPVARDDIARAYHRQEGN